MKRSASNTIAKIIGYALLLAVVVVAIGMIVYFTGGLTGDFKTFYVSVDGKDVLTSAGGYKVSDGKPLNVEVKYTFGSAGGDVSGYSVKVTPHAVEGKDFDFTLDGQVYSFQAESDLTEGFDIVRKETSFTVIPKGNVTEVLRAVYPHSEIADCSDKSYEDMYALVVSSYNGKQSVSLYFSLLENVSGVDTDKEVIIF